MGVIMNKYIKEINRKDLWNAGYVALYDFSKANSSEEHRIYAITEVVKVCRGDKPIKDREALYKQLLTEHAGKPGEAFQFVPIVVYEESADKCLSQEQKRFSMEDDFLYDIHYTNLRNIIGTNVDMYNDEIRWFYVFKMKIPKMIVAHLLKHGQLSFMQQSERHCKLREYYYCDELRPMTGRFFERDDESLDQQWNNLIYGLSQKEIDWFQQEYKIRQELLNKRSWGLGYTTLWMAGWKQDPTQWDTFFNVRLGKGVQRETKELANIMKKMINKNKEE